MGLPMNEKQVSVIEFIETVMKEEWEAMEAYRGRAAQFADPQLKTIFKRLSEMRAEYYKELKAQLVQIKSQAEITTQINDMFS